VAFLEFRDPIHIAAKDALWTVSFQNNVIALHQNFHWVSFVHLIALAQRFRKDDTPQLVDFSYYPRWLHHRFFTSLLP
jgi:hypothetical protein